MHIRASIAGMTHDLIVHPVLHMLVGVTATTSEAAPKKSPKSHTDVGY